MLQNLPHSWVPPRLLQGSCLGSGLCVRHRAPRLVLPLLDPRCRFQGRSQGDEFGHFRTAAIRQHRWVPQHPLFLVSSTAMCHLLLFKLCALDSLHTTARNAQPQGFTGASPTTKRPRSSGSTRCTAGSSRGDILVPPLSSEGTLKFCATALHR